MLSQWIDFAYLLAFILSIFCKVNHATVTKVERIMFFFSCIETMPNENFKRIMSYYLLIAGLYYVFFLQSALILGKSRDFLLSMIRRALGLLSSLSETGKII
jgi:hypothetical protein